MDCIYLLIALLLDIIIKYAIKKKTYYIDERGYVRDKITNRLLHRDIAWKHRDKCWSDFSRTMPFSKCEVHHINRKKKDNRPSNLQVLTPEQHRYVHGHNIKRRLMNE